MVLFWEERFQQDSLQGQWDCEEYHFRLNWHRVTSSVKFKRVRVCTLVWDLSKLTPLEYPLPLGVLVLILLYISMSATFITQQTLQGYPAGIWGTVKSLWQWRVWRYINNFNNNRNYSLYRLLSLYDRIMCSNRVSAVECWSISSIDPWSKLNQPLDQYPSTLDWHLSLTVDWQLTNFCRHAIRCLLIHLSLLILGQLSIECLLCIIECWSRWQLIVGLVSTEYRSRVN